MPKYVIERNIPGSGKLSAGELKNIAQTSCKAVRELAPDVQWVQSFVTNEKWYCIYVAPNSQMVLQHAKLGGFPADEVSEVVSICEPVDAE